MPEKSSPNPQFLHNKFRDLNTSPEVDAVVLRSIGEEDGQVKKQKRSKELIPQKPEARIQNYLDYLKECITIEDPHERMEKLEHIKQVLHEKYVTKPEDIPESYWASIIRRHRKEGHGDIEISEEQKAELTSDMRAEQTMSLDSWINYLASHDAEYPDWFKYYAIRSILSLNKFDKKKKQFTERTKGTISPFPDLNHDALALVCDALDKKQTGKELDLGYDISDEDKQQFKQYLDQENFAKMYAWAMEHFNPIPEELLQKINGEWRSFPKGSDPLLLTQSIFAYSTGWCIRGEATATRYLSHSDLEVYYSEDKDGKFTIPRIVVVRRDNQTQEMRGVAYQENLDPYINGVAKEKLDKLPDGKLFSQKLQDMERMSALEAKSKTNQPPTRDELIFLYEINKPIQGFGYQKDPRVKELWKVYNPNLYAPMVFICRPDQIAHKQQDIKEDTKAYVGPLFPNIFQQLKHLEHIYTSFPEGKIRKETISIGGESKNQLIAEMRKQKIQISPSAEQMMDNEDFTTTKESESAELVRLKVGDIFGDSKVHTTDEIYTKIEELGLELCPAEVGPHYRLQYADQSTDEYLYIGMKQISDSYRYPLVFRLRRDDGGRWLDGRWASPEDRWRSDLEFVFRLSKYKT